MKSFLLLVTMLSAAACLSPQAQSVAQRQPMEKLQHEYKAPVNYEPRVKGHDPETGEPITYDHKPRVELLDAKARKYAFKWIGLDGEEKTAIFQRADAVDVVVGATVSQIPSGEYLYTYEVKNLPSSGANIKRFLVQNFASNVQPEKSGDFMSGKMFREFGDGNWISFADVSDDVQINPGEEVTTNLTSLAPPGLVECRASAETVGEGAGEEMPYDLESIVIGYNEYPYGYTIGPVESLKSLPINERVQYVLDKLPQFQKLGWITDGASKWYEQKLKSNDLGAVSEQKDEDLRAGKITSEVFGIMKFTLQ